MGLGKSLIGIVDHIGNIKEASPGKKLAYSIIHCLIVALTFIIIHYFLEFISDPSGIGRIIGIIVLAILGIIFSLEAIFFAFAQLILLICALGDFSESVPLTIINILLSIGMVIGIIIGIRMLV